MASKAESARRELANREIDRRAQLKRLGNDPVLLSDDAVKLIANSSAAQSEAIIAAAKVQMEGIESVAKSLEKNQADALKLLDKNAKAQVAQLAKSGAAHTDQISSLETKITGLIDSLDRANKNNMVMITATISALSKTIDQIKPADYTLEIVTRDRAGFISKARLTADKET